MKLVFWTSVQSEPLSDCLFTTLPPSGYICHISREEQTVEVVVKAWVNINCVHLRYVVQLTPIFEHVV